jgi:hypothetical protein
MALGDQIKTTLERLYNASCILEKLPILRNPTVPVYFAAGTPFGLASILLHVAN